MKTKSSITRNSSRWSPLRGGFCLIAFIGACFALAPQARAVCQEGCGSLENTFLGFDALLNETTAGFNTALGANTLFTDTDGDRNTATGADALYNNTRGNDNTAIGFQALYNNYGIDSQDGYGNENTATG